MDMNQTLWPKITVKEFLFGGHVGGDFYLDGFHCLNPDFEEESKFNLESFENFRGAIHDLLLNFAFHREDGKAYDYEKDWDNMQRFDYPSNAEMQDWYKYLTNQTP